MGRCSPQGPDFWSVLHHHSTDSCLYCPALPQAGRTPPGPGQTPLLHLSSGSPRPVPSEPGPDPPSVGKHSRRAALPPQGLTAGSPRTRAPAGHTPTPQRPCAAPLPRHRAPAAEPGRWGDVMAAPSRLSPPSTARHSPLRTAHAPLGPAPPLAPPAIPLRRCPAAKGAAPCVSRVLGRAAAGWEGGSGPHRALERRPSCGRTVCPGERTPAPAGHCQALKKSCQPEGGTDRPTDGQRLSQIALLSFLVALHHSCLRADWEHRGPPGHPG